MLLPQPRADFRLQFAAEGDQLLGLRLRGATHVVVFHRVSFLAAAVKVVGVALAVLAQNVRQGRQHAEVRERSLGRLVALRVEQDRAEFQRGIVGDAILLIVRNTARGRVLQVALRDQPQVPDFLRTRLMALKPPGA